MNDLIKISDFLFEIPQSFRSDMRVPARIFADISMLQDILKDRSLEQIVNVATLPGIQQYALAMPDIHQGYGFPIGGVAAMSIKHGGIISPGGIGYDINCGVRLLSSSVALRDVRHILDALATSCARSIPSGVGRGGNMVFTKQELDAVLNSGAQHMVALGHGTQRDLDFCESQGCLKNADPTKVSDHAKKRGLDQLGTLGSGNHFVEIQYVEEIFDKKIADIFGLHEQCITIMIHTGSRGLGHQTCTDYVRRMIPELENWDIHLPDRELACAPFTSELGQDYFHAMCAAANFAWANRHMIAHNIRKDWNHYIGPNEPLNLVYDVAHNIGKIETHLIGDKKMEVIIHRKGATRAFSPGNPEIPAYYQSVGQPVIIPGAMSTASYVMAGTEHGMEASFGSTCHGAGRRLSRSAAQQMVQGSLLRKELEQQGLIIKCRSNSELAEESARAYKNIDDVVDIVASAKIALKVARLRPLAVIKGD